MTLYKRIGGNRRADYRRSCRLLLLLLTPLVLAGEVRSQAPPEVKPLTPQQQDRLLERDRLKTAAQKARAAGKLVEAIAPFEQALAIEREVLGESDFHTFWSMRSLAMFCAINGDFKAARGWIEEARTIQARVRPGDFWTLGDARRRLDLVEQINRLGDKQLKLLREATRLSAEGDELSDAGKFKDEIPSAARSVEIYKQLFGPANQEYLNSVSFLGWLYREQRDYKRAEQLDREALKGLHLLLGEDHPDVATTHNRLGLVYLYTDRYAEAEAQFRQAADIHGRTLGKLSETYALSLTNLAETFINTNDYRRAEALHREMLEISRQRQGEHHKGFARALMELAHIHNQLGEYGQAEPLLRQALAIYEKEPTVGPKHLATSYCLRELAETCSERDKKVEALALLHRVLEIQKQNLAPDDSNLAMTFHAMSEIYLPNEEQDRDYVKALEFERPALEIFRQGMGEKSEIFRVCGRQVAWLCSAVAHQARQRDDFAAASKAVTESIEIFSSLKGPDHWLVTNLRLDVVLLDALKKMTTDQRRQLAEAVKLVEKADKLVARKPREALAPAEQAWAIRRKLLGDEHWLTVDSESQVAGLYRALGDYAKAEPLYAALPELIRKTKGELHPDYVIALQNLASLDESQGKYQEAESNYDMALAAARKFDKDENRQVPIVLGNLAYVYIATGRYEQAESMFRQAIAIRKKLEGARSPGYAQGLLQLAEFYMFTLNDHVKAELLVREAIDIYSYSDEVGKEDPRYARAIDYLATYYVRTRQYDLAEPLYQQALAICKQSLGEKHRQYGMSLNNLAWLYVERGDDAEAVPLFAQALEIQRRITGGKEPQTALALANLALPYTHTGDYAKAEPLLREALEIRKQTLGEHHPDYVNNLSELATVYLLMNDPARAAPLAREAVHLARELLARNETFQSERQQLASRTTLWPVLNHYIDLCGVAKLPADEAYGEVLNWKGMISAGQQQLHRLHRQLKASGNKEVARLEGELEAATGQLAALYRAGNLKNRELQFRLDELSQRVEQIQKQLAAVSVDFRRQQSQQRRSEDEIRAALPADAALIDLLAYARVLRPDEVKAKVSPVALIAFVVRREGPVERVELGPAGPIENAIAAWRRGYGRKTAGEDPADQLQRLVWQPLEKHVAGAKLLLISPNSQTAPLPWPALRIAAPDVCLIDRYAVAVVPIARLLPELVASAPANESTAGPSGVLLVGDVDFGATPGMSNLLATNRSAARGSQSVQWSSLPGTRAEIAAIKGSVAKRFGDSAVTELSGDRATESAIRQAAEKHRYLHFSTHGFFAPPEVPSAAGNGSSRQDVSGFHPGLLSGLVLAGANRPVEEGREDGILTALEVAEMDLGGVELATLSACETGLGATGGGEGLLGLQRAFQSAGAKTVIAGLWKVPDEATQVLMSRFYDNLWQKRMSKVEALREAQLWMLREGGRPHGKSTRGLANDEDQPIDAGQHLPPYYWAAFILSGDWR
ncbi:MAG TPA: tetratricopeptide repeat protein [Pirellulales bacterium]|jgi:CHAT domain-containing protein/Tfp pilus assembly protein PilF|nr:tetratricopeptide repeat protein [Pirellulales bacterium]